MMWSDGRERADDYQGDALSIAIQEYFAERREEKLLELKWENEEFRRILREGEDWEISQAMRAMRATA